MGIQNRPRITVTVKGELVGDRILRVGTVIYSVLPNPDVPKYYDTCFFLLQKVGYVYAILNYVVLSLHNEGNRVGNEHGSNTKSYQIPNFPNIQMGLVKD